DPHRARAPPALRRLLRPSPAGRRGRAARGPRGEGRLEGADALGWSEARARPRCRADRRSGADLPRRADDRLRPRRPAGGLADDPQPPLAREDDSADDALHRGGTTARGPRRGAPARRDRRLRDAGRPDRRRSLDRSQLPAERRGGRDRDRGADPDPARAHLAGAPERTRARRARGSPPDARGDLPVAHRGPGDGAGMRLFLHQLRAEQLLFWRSRELAFFTFLLPTVFFFLLGSAYGDEEVNGVDGYKYLLGGMIGYGAAATTF